MGEHPGRARDTGTRVFGAFGKRWLRVAARYMPLPPATRAWLHPRRGVNVGRRVFIGTEVFIDDSVPSPEARTQSAVSQVCRQQN